MIFEGKSASEITDAELDALVKEHYCERQHLEFKVTVNYRDDRDRLEILRDIVSMANGGGGYIIVGIRDDGKGRAMKFEPSLVGDTERMKQAIQSLCHDYISERIEGLEVIPKKVGENPLLVIRVPSSGRKPHMVTFANSTGFYTRYQDGKREMTIGEIREAFATDLVGRRLTQVDGHLRSLVDRIAAQERASLLERIKEGEATDLLAMSDGWTLSEATRHRFVKAVGAKPYLWLSVTPLHPRRNLLHVDSPAVLNLIRKPPGSRPDGWSMYSLEDPQLIGEGIRRGDKNYQYLEVWENGHMEFWTPLDEHFCWRQSPDEFKRRPRLYPYAMTEYPATFFRLFRAIMNLTGLNEELVATIYFSNLRGYVLSPYRPDSVGFLHTASPPYAEDNLVVSDEIPSTFQPDRTAYQLIRRCYAAFGFGDKKFVPFYNQDTGEFMFD